MPDQVYLEFPKVIQDNLLSFSLNIVPSCISVHNNNIVLGHETGITVLSALPLESKLNLSISLDFAKNHTYMLINEYSNVLNDVQKIKYTSNYIVASNSNDDILAIDHINSTQFSIPPSGAVTSLDVADDLVAVIYDNKFLQIWSLSEQRSIQNIKLKNGDFVTFNNGDKEIILLEYGNVVQTISSRTGEVLRRHKLKSHDTVIDIIAGLNATVIYKDLNSYYLRPSPGTDYFAQLVSGVLEVSAKRVNVGLISKYPIVDGEVSDNFAAIVSGTKLFLVKY